jgi:hypothetical protein
LIAHEVAHTLQQGRAQPAGPLRIGSCDEPAEQEARNAERGPVPLAGTEPVTLRRQEADQPSLWQRTKSSAYDWLIEKLRSGQSRGEALLKRVGVPGPIVSALSGICDLYIQLLLAVVGIVVGFVSGIVQAVVGMVEMLLGVMEGLVRMILSVVTLNPKYLQDWLDMVGAALAGLIPGLENFIRTWCDDFSKATLERQTIMIGEVTGQVLAILATSGLVAGKAASAAEASGGFSFTFNIPRMLEPAYAAGYAPAAAAAGVKVSATTLGTAAYAGTGTAMTMSTVSQMSSTGGGGGNGGPMGPDPEPPVYTEREFTDMQGRRVVEKSVTKTYSGPRSNLRSDTAAAAADRRVRAEFHSEGRGRGGLDDAGHLHGAQQGAAEGETLVQAAEDPKNITPQAFSMNRQGSSWATMENELAAYRDRTGARLRVTVTERYIPSTSEIRPISRTITIIDESGTTPPALAHLTTDGNLVFMNPMAVKR